jgi:26S proteasome non-ATPase regulatory subunit 10
MSSFSVPAWVSTCRNHNDAQDNETRSSLPWEALHKGDTATFTQWLSQLNNVQELARKDEDGRTLLHWACAQKEWNPLVPLLLKAGSTIDTCDEAGFTPLHSSCSCGNTQVVECLLDAVQSLASMEQIVNAKTQDSQLTPLHCAASKNNVEICKLLIHKGHASVNVVDKHGYTPLMRAAQKGNNDCLKLLLDNGALCNLRNRQGDTALHLACEMGYRETVEILLAAGIDASILNEEGYRARDLLAPQLQGWWPERG